METWVLVLWIGNGYSSALMTVPGYESQAACQVAVDTAKTADRIVNRVFCIPGPKR